MSEKKFTTGPWSCRPYTEISFGRSNNWVVDAGDARICVVNAAGATASANAALIAAAPTLYEAMDQLLDDMGVDGLCVCQAAKDQAIAALAKARGET